MTIFGGFIAVVITDYIKRPKLEIIFKKEPDQQGGQKLHSNDDVGNSLSDRLLWEVEFSSHLERKKTIYCGISENVKMFGKIEDEVGYFPYNYDNIFEIPEGGNIWRRKENLFND